jgi:hypothetical protein
MKLEPVRVLLALGAFFGRKRRERVLVEFTVLAHALVYDKTLAVFGSRQGIAAVRALQKSRGRRGFGVEFVFTYFA